MVSSKRTVDWFPDLTEPQDIRSGPEATKSYEARKEPARC